MMDDVSRCLLFNQLAMKLIPLPIHNVALLLHVDHLMTHDGSEVHHTADCCVYSSHTFLILQHKPPGASSGLFPQPKYIFR